MPSPSPEPILPDLDNLLSAPEILEFNLKHNPTFPIYAFPGHEAGSITEISMLEFVRACHRVGHISLRTSKPGDVIAIVASIDTLVYATLIAGLINAGLVPFPISPRNSAPAILNLLRASKAHRLFTTQVTLKGVLDGLRSEMEAVDPSYELSIEEAFSLQELYPLLGKETADDPFTPFVRQSPPKISDLAMYLHSSGSTGFPKAIPLSLLNLRDYVNVIATQDFRDLGVKRLGQPGLPIFHIIAVMDVVLLPHYGPITTCIFQPMVTSPEASPIMMTADTVLENARLTKSDSLLCLPIFLHIWSHSEASIKELSQYKFAMYGGGPVPPRSGDALVKGGVKLVTGWGATEMGLPVRCVFSAEDWAYMEFHLNSKPRMVPQGDGTFEAQFLTTEKHHPAIENIPDVRGYSTGDLFRAHPTNPNKWLIVGRIDDVVVHASGEKTVPGPMEAILAATPIAQAALIFGRERNQPGLLLEPSAGNEIDVEDESQVSAFRNRIWPLVEEANKIAPAFSRIFKEMILITSRDKPLPRVGKGTVARKAAFSVYAAEIDRLYETVESNTGGDSVDPPESWEVADVETWLVKQTTEILSGVVPDTEKDLFEQGCDSLSATILRLHVVVALRESLRPASARDITQGLVYTYPNIRRLATYLSKLVNAPESTADEKTQQQSIEDMIAKYSEGLDASVTSTNRAVPAKHSVLLTGSTGNLGADLLALLLLNKLVDRVYAYNRASTKASILERHRERFNDKGLDSSLLSSPKLVFLEGDSAQNNLGLSDVVLEELRQNLTLVIHNAWKLDFNLTLSSFETQIRGTRNLIDLARSLQHASGIRFLFTSSISSAQSWDPHNGPYPEEVVLDAKYAVGSGYGESKYVTERILAKSGLHASSFRIGQVCGGEPNGAWSLTDWVPILVKSSLAIRALPDAYGVVSWIPMDAVARALLDAAFTEELPFAVNVVHPRPAAWTSVMQNLKSALIRELNLSSDALPLIPYQQWVSDIQEEGRKSQDIPALKLLDFFKLQSAADDALRKSGAETTMESVGLIPLHIENVKGFSETIANLAPLHASNVDKWVKYWIRAGL